MLKGKKPNCKRNRYKSEKKTIAFKHKCHKLLRLHSTPQCLAGTRRVKSSWLQHDGILINNKKMIQSSICWRNPMKETKPKCRDRN